MFAQAARLKLRFNTSKGLLTVEDLFDLPLSKGVINLNDLAKAVSRQLKAEQLDDEDFVGTKTKSSSALQLQLDILKYVIAEKLKEVEELSSAKDRKEHNRVIMDLIAQKQQQEMAGKSVAELQALLK